MKTHLHLAARMLCALFFIVVSFPTSSGAKDLGLGFILDDKNEARKVYLHTRDKLDLTIGRGFPFREEPVALSVREAASGKEAARIKLDPKICSWIDYDAYALDADRIVLNGYGDQGRNRFVAVWDWRKNQLRIYDKAGSGSSQSISGISPDEKWAISVPTDHSQGLLFHDIARGTASRMYEGSQILSPRFSPEGRQWAFATKSELIIRSTAGSGEKRLSLPGKGTWRYARHLAWSPSSRYIAAIIHHERDDLVIWDSDGNHLKTLGIPQGTATSWPPVWAADEKGVCIILGNEGRVGTFVPLQLTLMRL